MGKPRDSHENREEILSLIKNTGNIASTAAHSLKELSTLPDNNDKQSTSSRPQQDPERTKMKLRLRDDIERALNRFKASSTLAKEKLSSSPPPPASSKTTSPPSYEGFGRRPTSNQPNSNSGKKDMEFNLGNATPYNDEEDQERQRSNNIQRQKLVMLDDEMNLQDAIIAERDEGIKLIEREMMEVRTIFDDLANVVEEQQILFNHLDDHITSSVVQVERGVEEQRAAASYQKKGRNCTCILLLIVLGVVIAVILVLVVGVSVFRKQLPF